ncbi:MAG: hypothetical protein QXW70_03605 [Candidatus Anstonellales archaeon]
MYDWRKKEKLQEQRPYESVVEVRDIRIALNSYDDTLLDFDPHLFPGRQISADFLKELERRIFEGAGGKIEVRFYLPKERLKEKFEEQIIKRLQGYFRLRMLKLFREDKKQKQTGFLLILCGLLVILLQLDFKKGSSIFRIFRSG